MVNTFFFCSKISMQYFEDSFLRNFVFALLNASPKTKYIFFYWFLRFFLVEIASILFPERTFLKDVVFKIHNIKMITTSSRIEWL